MKSIKTKLVVYFSILILLSSLTIGVISMVRASDALIHEAEALTAHNTSLTLV